MTIARYSNSSNSNSNGKYLLYVRVRVYTLVRNKGRGAIKTRSLELVIRLDVRRYHLRKWHRGVK